MGDELRFMRILAILLRTYKLAPPLPNLTTAIQSERYDSERTYNLLLIKPKALLFNYPNLELKTTDEKVLSTA